jgi:hypothetical protein
VRAEKTELRQATCSRVQIVNVETISMLNYAEALIPADVSTIPPKFEGNETGCIETFRVGVF